MIAVGRLRAGNKVFIVSRGLVGVTAAAERRASLGTVVPSDAFPRDGFDKVLKLAPMRPGRA